MRLLTARSLTEEIDKQLKKKLLSAMPGKYLTYLVCATLTRWLSVAWFVFFTCYLGLNTYLQNRGMDIPEDVMHSVAKIVLIGFGIHIVTKIISGGLYDELTRYLKAIWANQA